jgi:Protein of unknown function with PCYCGC motif
VKRLLLIAISLAMLALLGFAESDNVPTFNAGPPTKADHLPEILSKDLRVGDSFQYPYQAHAYELAEKIPGVLHQLPCYCYCDRAHGHKSLRTCYESTHAAHCGVCLKEAYYAYQQTKLKKTAKQIREGIIRGDWQSIDLEEAATMN